MNNCRAGAAEVIISPETSQFLWGYPHVERYSTGIHDDLFSSALYFDDGTTEVLFIANDIIFITKQMAAKIRKELHLKSGIPEKYILISATHTHSGPMVVEYISNKNDAAVPKPDTGYITFLEQRIIQCGLIAIERAVPASIGFAFANGKGLGTNRRDPSGPSDPEIPVLVAVDEAKKPLACMLLYSMHPTVLHEDSTLVSGDFPGIAKHILKQELFSNDIPILYHTGPSGNQSPRHVVRANTFNEADRLSRMLAERIMDAVSLISSYTQYKCAAVSKELWLPRKKFPSADDSLSKLNAALSRFEKLKFQGASPKEIRNAECDWFGAEEAYTLSKAYESGEMDQIYESCLPAEVQCFKLGDYFYFAWPGEVFVEYALAVKQQCNRAYVISLANGELQGYIVTEEAAEENGYEASNGLFSPEAGKILVETSVELYNSM